VADLARFGGWDVSGPFAAGNGAVVAVLTHISGLAVVQRYDIDIPTGAGSMTGLADIGRYWMS